MGILSKTDENRLLRIKGLHDFVMQEKDKYIKKIRKWKKEISKDSELANPEMLAGSLTAYLKMWDKKLSGLMWTIWGDNELSTNEYYDIIGRWFVDREAETP